MGYAPYLTDAVKIEVNEYSPSGSKVANPDLKVEAADDQHPNDSYGVIDGINTMQNNNIAVVKMTPAKPSLTGTLYLFFKKPELASSNLVTHITMHSTVQQRQPKLLIR